jgi:hypothetical protein
MRSIFCTAKPLPRAIEAVATRRSIEANSENARRMTVQMPGRRGGPRRIVVVKQWKWPRTGVRLSVQFLDAPSAALRKRILSHMNAWSATANVKFTETHDTGDVRIARYDHPLDVAGYWSYLGTQILGIKEGDPTMNLQGFTMRESEAEFRRVVRHETGHTLGFDHEHMRGAIVERIDVEKAYRYYRLTNGWTRRDVDDQVLMPLDEASIMGTAEADPLSIMCYQIPGTLMKDGKAVPGGRDITRIDAAFAGSLYPKPARGRR